MLRMLIALPPHPVRFPPERRWTCGTVLCRTPVPGTGTTHTLLYTLLFPPSTVSTCLFVISPSQLVSLNLCPLLLPRSLLHPPPNFPPPPPTPRQQSERALQRLMSLRDQRLKRWRISARTLDRKSVV